jgi:hypothetical protein
MEASFPVKSPLWIVWVEIATEHERAAREARAALALTDAGQPLHLRRELAPAMIAITAAAFAVDGIASELEELVVPAETRALWRKNHLRRRSRILETLKGGCEHGGLKSEQWNRELAWLFDELRNPAVHHRARFEETVPHPLGVNTAPVYLDYSCERASEAVAFLFDVLRETTSRPKRVLPEWADAVA